MKFRPFRMTFIRDIYTIWGVLFLPENKIPHHWYSCFTLLLNIFMGYVSDFKYTICDVDADSLILCVRNFLGQWRLKIGLFLLQFKGYGLLLWLVFHGDNLVKLALLWKDFFKLTFILEDFILVLLSKLFFLIELVSKLFHQWGHEVFRQHLKSNH